MSDDVWIMETLPDEPSQEMPNVDKDPNPEDAEGCIPRWHAKDDDLFYGGQCVVPIARLFKIIVMDLFGNRL